MALTWDVSEIKDFTVVTTDPTNDKKWHPTTEALIWLSMTCGFNHIAEANHEKIFCRIDAYEHASGSMQWDNVDKPVPKYVSYEDVKRHIGLRTNASTKTDAGFAKEIMTNLYDNANARMRAAKHGS